MEILPIFTNIFSSLWYVIPIFLFIFIIKTPWFKGLMGEFIVNLLAKWLLDKKEYFLIRNVTLPTKDGTTQIDHIIVSVSGVFVVETKNMKGWIFGGQKQKMWTQNIFGHSNKFQNPLHQNYKHIKTLESVLGLNENQIHSVIVFIGDSTFKTKMPENVTYGLGYIRFIKSKKERVLTDSKVKDIIQMIDSGRLSPSIKTSIQHVKYVKEIIAEKESTPSCPKCGNTMIIREAKKGENIGKKFWGCSKFPHCRAVMNVM